MHTQQNEQQITRLLHDSATGDTAASNQLMAMIYPRLKAVVGRQMHHAGGSNAVQTTELLHEAYIKMVDQNFDSWQNRNQFFAVAARIIRRTIIDHIRHNSRSKRGGDAVKIDLDTFDHVAATPDKASNIDWLALDQALEELGQIDPEIMKVVELRYFAGFSIQEVAKQTNTSESTVNRQWRFARAWLRKALK